MQPLATHITVIAKKTLSNKDNDEAVEVFMHLLRSKAIYETFFFFEMQS